MEYVIIGVLVVAAAGAVAIPFFRKPATDLVVRDDAALERMINEYRVALKAGTVCDRCLKDNPAGSKFCTDCGLELGAKGS